MRQQLRPKPKSSGLRVEANLDSHYKNFFYIPGYRINYSFHCDSSNVVYLLECTVCGVQYVGSTCTPLGLGLIITRRAVASLIRGPQYPRRNSSHISLNRPPRVSEGY